MQINHQGRIITIPKDIMTDIKENPIDHEDARNVFTIMIDVLKLNYDNIITRNSVIKWRMRDNLTDHIIKEVVMQAILTHNNVTV